MMETNMIAIRDPKRFCFRFYRPKYLQEKLKYEFELIRKINESLAENNVKNKIEKLLLKYKDGNNIHQQGKQQNEWTT